MIEGIHYAKEIEKSILGLCLMEVTAFGRTYNQIDDESFYVGDHQLIYRTMREMYDKNLPIDQLSVWQKMESMGIKLNEGNTAYYLTVLTNSVTGSPHLEYHCMIIKDMWRKRELEAITQSGFDSRGDIRDELYKITERLNKIKGGDYRQDWFDMSELMFSLMQHQGQIKDGTKKFITTGIAAADKENGGFSAGQLIIIGARPSVGKSAFMGQTAIAMAKQGTKVGIISLEMNNNEIAARLASLETDIDFSKIFRNLFEDEKQQQVFYDIVTNKSTLLPIFVSDKTKVDANEIKSKLAKLIRQKGCDCLMVDYLQLIESPTDKKMNGMREQEVSKISRGMKLLAMEMQIPVIVLCQLNRNITGRGAKERYPKLSDLRESGSIEQDADIVLMVHRDFVSGYEEDDTGNTTKNQADLICLKWRNGSPFHLKMGFDPPKMKFYEKGNEKLEKPAPKDLFPVGSEPPDDDLPF